MSKTTTITIRLDISLKNKLEELSRSTQRSKSWLAAEAIATYLEREAWQIQQIQEAVQQADSPDAGWVAHEEVSDWLKKWGTEDQTAAPCL